MYDINVMVWTGEDLEKLWVLQNRVKHLALRIPKWMAVEADGGHLGWINMNSCVKLKEPYVVRTYDQEGFRKRAACVCVNEDETKVLLVTSRKDPSLWIVPGGGIEPDEAAASAAVREVKEEAGVSGTLGRCLGVFENTERMHRTSVFVLEVTEEFEDWDESHTFGRRRCWFSVEAAVSALHKPLQSNYVKLLLPPSHRYHKCPPHPHVEPIRSSPEPNIPPSDNNISQTDTDVHLESACVQPETMCSQPLSGVLCNSSEILCIPPDGDPSTCCTSPDASALCSSSQQYHPQQCSASVDCKEHCSLVSPGSASSSFTASISTG
ncbi:NUDIX hydrolase domain [Trinorchestia longiramus]|nr:NUDIX hydrolase domain [Trinorchestia longiramus]